uniref:Uncharacterized protein n=1 Tax=Anguilla anguilla TaxID=7936 RepID=A0A0E9PZQ2_ANGAN
MLTEQSNFSSESAVEKNESLFSNC